MRIVLQTSGFLPENLNDAEKTGDSLEKSNDLMETIFDNEWMDPFGNLTSTPSESKNKLRRHLSGRRIRAETNRNVALYAPLTIYPCIVYVCPSGKNAELEDL